MNTNSSIMLVNWEGSFIFYLQSPTSSCKSSIQMLLIFRLFCNFSKHHSGFVCIDLSLITGARKACATIELLAEETIIKLRCDNNNHSTEKYNITLVWQIVWCDSVIPIIKCIRRTIRVTAKTKLTTGQRELTTRL